MRVNINLVFSGGSGPTKLIFSTMLAQYPDLTIGSIIAADSGLSLCLDLGFSPDFVVGDMDSVDQDIIKSIDKNKLIVFDTHKDFTDTELALSKARECNDNPIWLIGGGAGRMDHFLANYALFARANPMCRWITENASYDCVEGEIRLDVEPGELISIFPVHYETRCQSTGLLWELDGLRWGQGDFGISNKAKSNIVKIKVLCGRIIIFRELPSFSK